MILTCPSCATSYFTPDEAIGEAGRRVRCRTCAHIWHAMPVEDPLELSQSPEAAVLTPPVESGPGFGKRNDALETLASIPAPELPKAFRARAEAQRRVRRAATHGAVWASLASVFVAIVGAAWLFRVEVVDLYPRAAAAYAMVGSPVNPIGLQFEAVGAKPTPNDPAKVLVSGALRNVRDREIVAPAIRLALLDAHGAEIGYKIVSIDAAPVLPGGVQGFAAVIPDPGAKGVGVGVDFVVEAKPAKTAHTAEPHDAKAEHASAPGHATPEPTADHALEHRLVPQADDHDTLRPAISPDVEAPMRMTPIDAVPTAAPTHEPAPHH